MRGRSLGKVTVRRIKIRGQPTKLASDIQPIVLASRRPIRQRTIVAVIVRNLCRKYFLFLKHLQLHKHFHTRLENLLLPFLYQ
jgi:hypothetical protein